MSPTSLVLNVLWIVFGGLWMAAGWLLAAVIMAITIIGLPWARAALTIAVYTFLPFGHTVVDRPSGIGSGPLGCLGNVIWLVLAGWWLALAHLITALGWRSLFSGCRSLGRISSSPDLRLGPSARTS